MGELKYIMNIYIPRKFHKKPDFEHSNLVLISKNLVKFFDQVTKIGSLLHIFEIRSSASVTSTQKIVWLFQPGNKSLLEYRHLSAK